MVKEKPKRTKKLTGMDISDLSKVRPTKIPTIAQALPEKPTPIRYRQNLIHLAIIIGIVWCTFAISLKGHFVLGDEYLQTVTQSQVSSPQFWTKLYIEGVLEPLAQPWLTASLAWDYQNFGLDAVWYHFINVNLHCLSCLYFYLLIFMLMRRWSSIEARTKLPYEVAFFAAVLLACHPIVVESVSYVTGRESTLVACNLFLALICFMHGFFADEQKQLLLGYIAALLFFLMSVLSGAQGLAIPWLMLCLTWLFKPEEEGLKKWWQERWPDYVFIGFLCIISILIYFLPHTAEFGNNFGAPVPASESYFASQFRALPIYYLRCLFFPIGLSVDPPGVRASTFFDIGVMGGIVLSFLFLALACYVIRNKVFRLALALFLLSILPSSLIVQGELAADHRFYLPTAAFAVVIAWYMANLRYATKTKYIALSVLVIIFCGLSNWRNFAWSSGITLWQNTLELDRNNARAYAMLAKALMEEGKLDEAQREAERAIKYDENSMIAYLVMGNIAHVRKDYEKAKVNLEKALILAHQQKLGIVEILLCQRPLSSTYYQLGEYEKAHEAVSQVLEILPASVTGNLIMGKCLVKLKQPLLALKYLNEAYTRDRLNYDLMQPIAQACLDSRNPKLIGVAYGVLSTAVKVTGTFENEYLYSIACLESDKLIEARKMLDHLIPKQPKNPYLLFLKGVTEDRLGNKEEGAKWTNLAKKLHPKIDKEIHLIYINKIPPKYEKMLPH